MSANDTPSVVETHSPNPVFDEAYPPAGPKSEDLEAVNAALHKAANSLRVPPSEPFVMAKPHPPTGAPQPAKKFLPDSLRDGAEGTGFFGARSPA